MARSSRAPRARGRGSTRTRTSARTGVIEIFTRPESSLIIRLLGLVVRLRAELTVLALLVLVHVYAWQPFQGYVGYWPSIVCLTILLGIVLGVPASRRFLGRRWWSITTRHRMRACFVQTRTMTHNGKLPFLLWSRPSPVGERVRVWLPAGLSVKDLEQVTAETAAACWASDVRVTPNRRQAALVVVEVIRRDPLTGNPLRPGVVDDLDISVAAHADDLDNTSKVTGTDGIGGIVVPLPTRTTLPLPATRDLPDTDTVVTNGGASTNGAGQTGARPRTRKTSAPAEDTASTGEPPVTGFGGVDVSDYV